MDCRRGNTLKKRPLFFKTLSFLYRSPSRLQKLLAKKNSQPNWQIQLKWLTKVYPGLLGEFLAIFIFASLGDRHYWVMLNFCNFILIAAVVYTPGVLNIRALPDLKKIPKTLRCGRPLVAMCVNESGHDFSLLLSGGG
jgi:hypothetical protein